MQTEHSRDRRTFPSVGPRFSREAEADLPIGVAEFLVDLFPAGETVLYFVPELDRRLVHLPAEVNFLAAEQGGKIHQAHVQVLDHAIRRLIARRRL